MTDVDQNNDKAGASGGMARESDRSAKPSPGRRAWLLGACAGAAALAFASAGRSGRFGWSPFGSAFAADAPGSAASAASAPVAASGVGTGDAFIALTRHLTGRPDVDATLGKRVYDALAHDDPQFAQHVSALGTWMDAHAGTPPDTLMQTLQGEQPDLAKAATAVMRAWYLGLVGDMPKVQVVAYERALMFDPVRDVLTVPSYCRDVPFYWAAKPLAS